MTSHAATSSYAFKATTALANPAGSPTAAATWTIALRTATALLCDRAYGFGWPERSYY